MLPKILVIHFLQVSAMHSGAVEMGLQSGTHNLPSQDFWANLAKKLPKIRLSYAKKIPP